MKLSSIAVVELTLAIFLIVAAPDGRGGGENNAPIKVTIGVGTSDKAPVAIGPVDPVPKVTALPASSLMFSINSEQGRIANPSRTIFQIDGATLVPSVPAKTVVKGKGGVTTPNTGKATPVVRTWNANGLQVTQTLEPIAGRSKIVGKKRSLDVMLVKYTIENKDAGTHEIAMSVRAQTMAPRCTFTAPTMPNTELDAVQLSGKTLPDYVHVSQQPNPQIPPMMTAFTLKLGDKVIGPDEFICTSLGASFGNVQWPVPVVPANGQSACVLTWNARKLPANGKVEFAYAYGMSIASPLDGVGLMNLSLGGSFEPGKTFEVMAIVNDPSPNQTLTLDLPEGMKLTEGHDIQPVPIPIADSQSSVVMWKGRVERLGEFPVRVRSSNGSVETRVVSVARE